MKDRFFALKGGGILGVLSFFAIIALVVLSGQLIYKRLYESQSVPLEKGSRFRPLQKRASLHVKDVISSIIPDALQDKENLLMESVLPPMDSPEIMIKSVNTIEGPGEKENTKSRGLNFDMARVEPSGNSVFAGWASPGAFVSLHNKNLQVGTTVADERGNWVVVLEKPLPSGVSEITLSARGPDGVDIKSEQVLAVVLDEDRIDQPLVLVQDRTGVRNLKMPKNSVHVRSSSVLSARTDAFIKKFPALPSEKNLDPMSGETFIASFLWKREGLETSLIISGKAMPRTVVRIHHDELYIGSVSPDKKGRWTFQTNQPLDGAHHILRFDYLEAKHMALIFRAELPFVASFLEEGSMVLVKVMRPLTKIANLIAGEGALSFTKNKVEEIIVQRGDSLWEIAKAMYGEGEVYQQIYNANRDLIHHPDLIYPGQVFTTPHREQAFGAIR
ncbi:MAG: LysM peptidoglycan-binding domain-containing protein [Alphaproteobacteria bacterium]|nr:LysM peptidoglycan-binding domain-containing protein [Alphaproteobacteria bacterium]